MIGSFLIVRAALATRRIRAKQKEFTQGHACNAYTRTTTYSLVPLEVAGLASVHLSSRLGKRHASNSDVFLSGRNHFHRSGSGLLGIHRQFRLFGTLATENRLSKRTFRPKRILYCSCQRIGISSLRLFLGPLGRDFIALELRLVSAKAVEPDRNKEGRCMTASAIWCKQ